MIVWQLKFHSVGRVKLLLQKCVCECVCVHQKEIVVLLGSSQQPPVEDCGFTGQLPVSTNSTYWEAEGDRLGTPPVMRLTALFISPSLL